MARHIFKYKIKELDKFDKVEALVKIPKRAKLLHAEVQGRYSLVVWAEVEEDDPLEEREFLVLTTGSEVPEGFRHISTIFFGMLVLHLYARATLRDQIASFASNLRV